MRGPLRVAWTATLLAIACGRAVYPESRRLCIYSTQAVHADLSSDARAVCRALADDPGSSAPRGGGERPPAVAPADRSTERVRAFASSPGDRNEMMAEIDELARSPRRILYYTGHGRLDEAAGDLEFLVEGGEPLGFARMLARLEPSPDGHHGSTGIAGWSIIFLNTCDSGYAGVHAARGAVTLLGSGYGAVGAKTDRPDGTSAFARALAEALEGEADRGPEGNCDGLVTDREAADYVEARLRDMVTHDTNRYLWKVRPTAVLRRQWDGEVPIAWHEPAAECRTQGLESFLKKPWFLAFPRELRTELEREAVWTRAPPPGDAGPPPAASRRYVLVDRRIAISDGAKAALERMRVEFVDSDAPPAELMELAKKAFATDMLRLTSTPGYTRGSSVWTLVRLRNGANLWTYVADRDRSLDWPSLLYALPRWFELFETGLESDHGEMANAQPLYLQINGRVAPDAVLRLVSWQDFLAGSNRSEELRLGKPPKPVPCLGGYGQCFEIEDPACAERRCPRRRPWEWLVFEKQ